MLFALNCFGDELSKQQTPKERLSADSGWNPGRERKEIMKHRCVNGIATLSLCLAAVGAQAQYYYDQPEGSGLYVRAAAGPSFFQDGRLTKFGTFGAPASSAVDYRTGLAGDAAVGWAFNRYLSIDGETGFVGAKIDNVPGYFSDDTRVYNVPFLANLTLSYPIPHTILVPYIGGGAGGADTIFDTHGFGNGIDTVYGRENDVVFAWQAFAGLRFRIMPNLSLGIGYKYFTTQDTSYSYPPSPNFDVGFRGVQTHSALVTFEWKFW